MEIASVSMNYESVEAARDMDGLRLAMTVGVPGPWSQAAKFIFELKGIPYIPVAQYAGQPNAALIEWTGCRNAPVAIWNDEPPKSNWSDIISLADRIEPERPLMPSAGRLRVLAWGLTAEMAAEGGFGWTRRLMSRKVVLPDNVAQPSIRRDIIDNAYGGTDLLRERAFDRASEILKTLAEQLHAQAASGSDYFVGDSVTAPDVYWTAFSQMLEPLPHSVNPMPEWLRVRYSTLGSAVIAKDPILLRHRDMMFERHLSLPLTF